MKRALKIIIACVLCIGLLAGGVFAYLKFRKVPPCEVYPAMQWMMSYMPNQTYLYGIVTSDASQVVLKSADRNVLEILVKPGDTVTVGDPLLRYDATRAELPLKKTSWSLSSSKTNCAPNMPSISVMPVQSTKIRFCRPFRPQRRAAAESLRIFRTESCPI